MIVRRQARRARAAEGRRAARATPERTSLLLPEPHRQLVDALTAEPGDLRGLSLGEVLRRGLEELGERRGLARVVEQQNGEQLAITGLADGRAAKEGAIAT